MMLRIQSLRVLMLLILTSSICILGCGGGKEGGTPVQGKVIFAPRFPIEGEDSVEVFFLTVEEGENQKRWGANFTYKDGSFSIPDGVPPGQYRVGVMISPYVGAGPREKHINDLNNRYGANATTMTIEIPDKAEGINVTVDVGKEKVDVQ